MLHENNDSKLGELEKKRTLMDAINSFQDLSEQLQKLESLTGKLEDKFNRTEDLPKGASPSSIQDKCPTPVVNIIELFDSIGRKMAESIDRIGNNTQRVINMID